MGIRWDPFAVEQAMGDVSLLLDGAEPIFKMARDRVKEAESIPNLPEYMKQHLRVLNQELGRLDGMRKAVERVCEELPKEELKKARATGLIQRPTLIG